MAETGHVIGVAGSGNAIAVVVDTAGNEQQIFIEGDGAALLASLITGDTGQVARVVAGSRKEVSFTTTTAQAVASTDVSNYRWLSVHIVTQGGSSTVTFQGSNDNVNWTSVGLLAVSAVGSTLPAVSSVSANQIYAGPANFRYFRLNVTGIVSGTTAGVIELFAIAPAWFSNQIALTGTSSVSGTVTVTSTTANQGTAGTAPWMVTIGGDHVTAIAAGKATDTVIKATAGRLFKVLVTAVGTNAMQFFDNASAGSGTIIGVVPASAAIGSVYEFGLLSSNGITSLGNAANPAVTVGWD